MVLCIADALGAADLAKIVGLLADSPFRDGRATAGWHAKRVKRNEQGEDGHVAVLQAGALALAALRANEAFRAAVLPHSIRPIMFSRYGEGMSYGPHVDNAIMGGKAVLRSDVSLTLFLNQPAEYDGGELVIETDTGEQSYKLAAGSVIAYPSTTLHRVEPVTRGTRLVGVTWVQSLVRDEAERQLLADLDTVRRAVFREQSNSREFNLLSKCYSNLLRKWVQG